jgi:hypothetical protein
VCKIGAIPNPLRLVPLQGRSRQLAPMIDIIEPQDIIFAQIATNLDLDQLQRDFSRIREAMHRSNWNVCEFIFNRDLGDAVYHYPMLRTVKVLLQRQPAA